MWEPVWMEKREPAIVAVSVDAQTMAVLFASVAGVVSAEVRISRVFLVLLLLYFRYPSCYHRRLGWRRLRR